MFEGVWRGGLHVRKAQADFLHIGPGLVQTLQEVIGSFTTGLLGMVTTCYNPR